MRRGNRTMMLILGAFLLSTLSVSAVPEWKLQKKLYDYIIRDNVKEVAKMLKEHPNFAKKKIEYHNYPVFEAARAGALKTLKLLVANGASPAVRDSKTGDTIIHYMFSTSSTKNREKILDYLVNEKNIRIDATNNAKSTPFLVLFGDPRGRVNKKNAAILIPLFKKFHANFNAKDKTGMAALHYLSKIIRIMTPPEKTSMRNQNVAMMLLKYGADPNIANKLKQTPLLIFLISAKKLPVDMKEEYVNCLLDYGAKPKAKSKNKKSPLKLVERKGKLYEMMKKRRKKKKPIK